MHFTRMEEITPTKAPRPQAFPTGAIIKEAWQICTTYFWPITMAIFVIQIPEKTLTVLADGNPAWNISFWYEALVSGFVFVGIYRSIYRLKAEGIAPTFSGIYGEGQPYYGRNFRLILSFNIYSILVMVGVVVLILPCAIFYRDSANNPWAAMLLAISSIIGVIILTWWAARLFIYRAVLADESTGATKAIEEAFRLTKGKALKVTPLLLFMLGVLTIFVLFFLGSYLLIAGGLEDVPKSTEVKIVLLSSLPFAFMEAFGVTLAALAYLHLKEESRLVVPAEAPSTSETPVS
jgi:hypothetical protein